MFNIRLKNINSEKIKDKISKPTILFFLLTTIFFIVQRSHNLSWDFSVYVLNAKHWFDDGFYFEPLRPPLTPLLIGLFSVFGWSMAEYLYTILVAMLFLFSTLKLADALRVDKTLFYVLSLNIFTLTYGILEGTELLSLALMELFVAGIIQRKNAGLFLGLAAMTRYNYFYFLPLIIFYKDFRRIVKNAFLFLLPVALWLFYNKAAFGNMFTSIADNYAINFLYRTTATGEIWHFIFLSNLLTPFFFIGLIILLRKMLLRKTVDDKSCSRATGITIMMIIILLTTVFFYFTTPAKLARYLFAAALPVAYFSAKGVSALNKKRALLVRNAYIYVSMALTFLLIFHPLYDKTFPALSFSKIEPEPYKSLISLEQKLNTSNCAMQSNSWVALNYLGRPAEPMPRSNLFKHYLKNGYIIAAFHDVPPKYDSSFLHSFPVLYEGKSRADNYTLIGLKDCKHYKPFVKTYLDQLNETIFLTHKYSIETNPCSVLFSGIAERACLLVN